MMIYDTILVRLGELALKGKNRSQFESRLIHNINTCLFAFPQVRVHKTYGRIYIDLNGCEIEPIIEQLKKVFGIVSFSPAIRVAHDMNQIKEAALAIINDLERPPATFKVSARRTDRTFPFSSQEIPHHVGGYILAHREGIKVDVHQPDIEIKIEVREEGVYIMGNVIPGAGGFPVGTNGKVLLMLSGGIDSPVAGWFMLKKGVRIEAIHFHSYPFTSERAKQKVIDLTRILTTWGGRIRLHVVPFTEIQTEIKRTCPEDLLVTVMRRYMMRIAERVAEQIEATAIATGESLGQVASQTLDSMNTINRVIQLPVLRPLIAMDKTEIIEVAQKIGTFETSILPYEDCCTIFTPKNPRTKPKPKVLEKVEAKSGMDMEQLIASAIEGIEVIELKPQKPIDKTILNSWF
jgi:thiamine biosynthesis protein ThiI